MFFCYLFDTVNNICIKTLILNLKENVFFLLKKIKKGKSIGYARAIDSEFDYLEEQIKNLRNDGCNVIFSEIISLEQEIKPEFKSTKLSV